MTFKKKEYYARTFMGAEYDFDHPQSIGELRGMLEEMLQDLPEDGSLEIAEFHCGGTTIYYCLKVGVPDDTVVE